jgi:autotransporter-associated beta strand protein
MKKHTYREMMVSVFVGAMTVCGTAQAATNSWNVSSGTWDTSTANWKAPTTWTDGDSALFTNRLDAVTVTVSGARSAELIRLGMSQINSAYYTFVGGSGSIKATNFVVQFQTDGGNPKTILTNLTMTLSGKLAVGRGWLVLAGTSAVSADRFVSSGDFGGDGTWGNLWLKDTASLSLPNGIVPSYNALLLDGGTLATSYITMPDWGPGTFGNCVLNGGRIVALPGAQNSNFFQNNAGNTPAKPYGPYVSTRGVVFDSDTNSITIKLPFKHDTNGAVTDGGLIKLGSGTLTFSGATNTYNGMTIVSNGTLAVSNMGALSAGDVTVANGATLSLNSARAGGAISDSRKVYVNGSSTVSIATGVDETVYEFYLDGIAQTPGVWGRVGGSAANQSARFSGDGTLTVTHSPAPFSWNVGTGAWDLATTNWLWNGAAATWAGRCDALFTNRSDAVTVTVNGNLTAETIRVGNGSNNWAKYTFVGGSGVSITATKFVSQFLNDGADKVTILTNLSMTLSGKLAAGRIWLVLAGNTAVTADKFVTSDDAEFYVAGPDLGAWGNLWLKDTATLRLTNGVVVTRPNILKLDGGTLYTSYLKISDLGSEGNSSILNGTRIVALPSAQNSDFIQFSFGNTVYVSTSGAVIDSDTNNITVKALFKHYSAGAATDGGLVKYGSGTLTLSATNTYNGATAVSNGTLSVNGSLTNANITVAAGATLTGSGTIRCRVSAATNDLMNVSGTATLSGLTLALNVQGLLPAGSYVLAKGLGAAQFNAVTGIPQQAGRSFKVSYVNGQLALVVSNKGTLISVL